MVTLIAFKMIYFIQVLKQLQDWSINDDNVVDLGGTYKWKIFQKSKKWSSEYRVIKEREYGVASGCWTQWTTHQPFHEIKMLNTEEEHNYSPAPPKAARFSAHALSREQQCLLHHLLQVASWLEQIAHQLCCPWSSPQCRRMPPLQ